MLLQTFICRLHYYGLVRLPHNYCFLQQSLCVALPSSVTKPVIESCRLYTDGGITSKPGARYACLYTLSWYDFLHKVTFDNSSAIPLQSPLYYLPDYFISLFSYVHYSRITPFAAKSGLTTPPAQRCRYFAVISLHHCCIIFITTCSAFTY